jgi:hypothetical protein
VGERYILSLQSIFSLLDRCQLHRQLSNIWNLIITNVNINIMILRMGCCSFPEIAGYNNTNCGNKSRCTVQLNQPQLSWTYFISCQLPVTITNTLSHVSYLVFQKRTNCLLNNMIINTRVYCWYNIHQQMRLYVMYNIQPIKALSS